MKFTAFDLYKDLLREKCGMALSQDQIYLLESRLNPVSRKWGYDTLDAMTMTLQGVPDPDLVRDIIESMTDHETSFFRDGYPFEIFENHILPHMKQARSKQRKLKIWCAASSSGQEPYSLAIMLQEAAADFPDWSFEIHATDISNEILNQAREAKYTQFEVQRGLPIRLLIKYFTQEGNKWQLHDGIKKMVRHERANLIKPAPKSEIFDIIFCRNTLCAFDENTQKTVLESLSNKIALDGFFVLDTPSQPVPDALTPVPDKHGLYTLSH